MSEAIEREQGISYAEPAKESFGAFVDTIAALRRPDGCPWDKVQTHGSIAKNMIEEAYEAVDAIEHNDMVHLREELGDVLLQVVLQSQIAADEGAFTIDDVCADVNEKMIRRHPHIFGDAHADSPDDVRGLWEDVKTEERKAAQGSDDMPPEGLLDSVPSGFPALMQAQKISKKAVKAGFEWDTVDDVWDKVAEEEQELREAYAAGDKEAMDLELGDVLFALVNVGRKMGLDSEMSLRASCVKFRKRWALMEQAAAEQGRCLDDMSMDELQDLWDNAKTIMKKRIQA